MSYKATVLEIMIASPSDVLKQRGITREVIDNWNSANSSSRQIFLRAVGWETHSTPEMGDRPQSIINRQLLSRCDLLIGVFWTRIGTPTGEFASGTAEEIETHIRSGKPVMIYFSTQPVVPDSLDQVQYEQLKVFKKHCMDTGLIETFDSEEVFRDKLTRQLATKINEDPYIAKIIADAGEKTAQADSKSSQQLISLSKEAIELLLAATQDRSGQVIRHRSSNGTILVANGKQFGKEGEPREAATWHSALLELLNNGLLQRGSENGVLFQVTRQGYEFVEEIGPVGEKGYPTVGPIGLKR